MTHRSSSRRGAAGFTLVELLVSLLILAMMTVISAGALNTGRRVWETAETHVTHAETMLAIRRLLRDQINGMIPIKARFDRQGERPLVDGTADRLVFVTALPTYFGRMGLYRVEYRLEGDALIFARSPYQTAADFNVPQSATTQETLMDNVAGLEFRYLGGRAGRLNWADETTEFDDIPQLIEVRIELDGDRPRDWPSLTISTRIDEIG